MTQTRIIFCTICVFALGTAAFAQSYEQQGYPLNVPSVAAEQYQAATQEGSTRSMLLPDVEWTSILQSPHELRNSYYHGQKDETVTLKVKSVQFAPQVFVRGPNGDIVLQDMNSSGEHELETSWMLASDGDYNIQVRASGAGQGVFHILVHSEPPPTPSDAAGGKK